MTIFQKIIKAGFQIETGSNRLKIKTEDFSLHLFLIGYGFVLSSKTKQNKTFCTYTKKGANFTITHRAKNPIFATVDFLNHK